MSRRVPVAKEAKHLEGTLSSRLKRLQINPINWEDLTRDRPTWRRTVKTGAAIYEANHIAAANAKQEALKSQLHSPRNAKAQPLPTCSRCQRPFRAPSRLVRHVPINCTTRAAPTVVPPSNSPSPSTPSTNSGRPPKPSLPASSSSFSSSSSSSSSSCSSSTASTSAVVASVMHINTTLNQDTPTKTNTTIAETRREKQDYTCPHCDRIFTSHIGLVGHLRIHRTETGAPVPGSPTCNRRTRLHRSHCPCTFMHRMSQFSHMRIYESEIHRSPETFSTPAMPTPSLTPSPCAHTSTSSITPSAHCTPTTMSPIHRLSLSTPTTTISVADTGTTDFSCPHCDRIFTSHIGLVGHLRIHRTETGEPVSEAPTYACCIRLYCRH
nr:unnamed protein product [Spirometra erinaceieuropaei]